MGLAFIARQWQVGNPPSNISQYDLSAHGKGAVQSVATGLAS
jgi:hypothetical protein